MISAGRRKAKTRSQLDSVRWPSLTWSALPGCTVFAVPGDRSDFNSKYFFGGRVPSHLSTSI